MLNNEKAALALVTKIYKGLKSKKKAGGSYFDPDFGPRTDQDEDGSRFAMYKTGEMPKKGYPDPKKVTWVPIQKLVTKKDENSGKVKTTQFVDDGVASDDCMQGNLGDCWLISAMSVLATRDELLIGGRKGMEYDPDMIIDKDLATILSNGVYPPIFHKFRSIGLFVIRVFKNFQWIYILVDTRVPAAKDLKTGKMKPVFGRCRETHEMWVALIEKAYAKMHGCYENLISGYVDEGI
jgi:hypothetical protein